MALPYVRINFKNGQLGSVDQPDDSVCGLVSSATAVSTTFTLGTAYLITNYQGLSALGITAANNARLEKCVREFYDEAPSGTKLWIMGVQNSVTVTDICDKTKNYAKTLLLAAHGAIRTLMVAKSDASSYTPTMQGAIDKDTTTAITKAQLLADEMAETQFAPLLVLLEGRHYSGTASGLNAINTGTSNRVAVIIGDSVANSVGAAVGLVGGRIASIPVQRSIARVKSGPIPSDMYIGAVAAEDGQADVISDAGFICPRVFVGKAGYYWSDDKLATSATDDYALIPRRRIIDKAYREVYYALVDEVGDEIPVTNEGKIPAAICKAIQASVESRLESTMTVNGNVATDATDPNDTGVKCYVDPNQNIVSTSKLLVSVAVRPYGYAKYIEVDLGFSTND